MRIFKITKYRIAVPREKLRRNEKIGTTSFWDPTDIATDDEAATNSCNCIIHSNGRRVMSEPGYMLLYKQGGEE